MIVIGGGEGFDDSRWSGIKFVRTWHHVVGPFWPFLLLKFLPLLLLFPLSLLSLSLLSPFFHPSHATSIVSVLVLLLSARTLLLRSIHTSVPMQSIPIGAGYPSALSSFNTSHTTISPFDKFRLFVASICERVGVWVAFRTAVNTSVKHSRALSRGV